ncbi:MAG: D-alanyl-D-alanine carboxypeptidase [Ruminococcaceae bacterium]|nr:D-alanyl-D-alanine carboxypeptidase [Oscillospiraceae bacterium]
MKKKLMALFCALGIILFASCSQRRANAVLHDKETDGVIAYHDVLFEIEINSPQGFVYDVQKNKIVFTKGEDQVIYPGSTSKLLTALFSLSVLPKETVITAGNELSFVKEGSSVAYIKKGHRLTVEMLVEAMLLPSGNDAAYVLATAVGRALQPEDSLNEAEAVAVFIQNANDYAKELGLCGTTITVPDGYADEEHYTTTEDLAILAKYALENETICKYASMYKDSVIYASGHTNTWENTNLLLNPQSKYYSRYATGLKTGSVSGEYSLLFSFRLDDGREYIAGVFGADRKNIRFEDANAIIHFFEQNQF